MALVSFGQVVRGWQLDPTAAALIAGSMYLYVRGVRRLAAKGRSWPVVRSVSWG